MTNKRWFIEDGEDITQVLSEDAIASIEMDRVNGWLEKQTEFCDCTYSDTEWVINFCEVTDEGYVSMELEHFYHGGSEKHILRYA